MQNYLIHNTGCDRVARKPVAKLFEKLTPISTLPYEDRHHCLECKSLSKVAAMWTATECAACRERNTLEFDELPESELRKNYQCSYQGREGPCRWCEDGWRDTLLEYRAACHERKKGTQCDTIGSAKASPPVARAFKVGDEVECLPDDAWTADNPIEMRKQYGKHLSIGMIEATSTALAQCWGVPTGFLTASLGNGFIWPVRALRLVKAVEESE